MPPSLPRNVIEVAHTENTVLLRAVGLGDMHIAPTLNEFVLASLEKGWSHFVLDLQKCTGMDSTFMGTIVKISSEIREAEGWFCLINVSAENRNLLKMLGVWELVDVKESFPVEAVETERLLPTDNPRERLRQIQLAHQHLVEIDERNRKRFGPFLASLEEEMQRLKPDIEDGRKRNESH